MPLGLHFVPDLLDFPVGANQKTAAHNALERASHELLHTPHTVSLNHFVGWITQQRKIQPLLGLETLQSLHRVRAGPQNGHAQLVELRLCVTKLGRLNRSTRRVRLRKEKEQHPPARKILQRDFLALV